MNCEYDLCIYQKKGQCSLDVVSINMLGMCDAAQIVTIPGKDLIRHKHNNLQSLSRRWRDTVDTNKGE